MVRVKNCSWMNTRFKRNNKERCGYIHTFLPQVLTVIRKKGWENASREKVVFVFMVETFNALRTLKRSKINDDDICFFNQEKGHH